MAAEYQSAHVLAWFMNFIKGNANFGDQVKRMKEMKNSAGDTPLQIAHRRKAQIESMNHVYSSTARFSHANQEAESIVKLLK